MSHLDEGTLHALLDGEIPSSELPAIQTHLAECGECRARLDAERALLGEALQLVETLEVPAEPAPVRKPPVVPVRRSRTRELAWAASLVLAAGLGYLVRGPSKPQLKTTTTPVSEIAGTNPPTDSAVDQPVAANPAPPAAREPVVSRAPTRLPQRRDLSPPSELGKREAKTTAETRAGAALAERTDSTRVTSETAPITAAPPAPAGPMVGGIGGASRVLGAESRQNLQSSKALLRTERAKPGSAPTADAFFAPPEPITFQDAIRRLGGSLRLIEGMVPARLEAQGAAVRVVYSVAQGELVLSQQLVDGRLSYALIAPPGFAPDSLAKLRGRVRE